MVKYPNVMKVSEEEDKNKSPELEEPGHHFMEGQTSRRSFPEDPCSQNEFPDTASPGHYYPEDDISQDSHPSMPSPRHYYPEDLFSPIPQLGAIHPWAQELVPCGHQSPGAE